MSDFLSTLLESLGPEVTPIIDGEEVTPSVAPVVTVSLDGLNEYQQAVVQHRVAGPSVVEACPGSGKTRTGEALVAELIAAGDNPARMCYVTFSAQAAAESRRRIARTLFPQASQAEIDYLEDPGNKDKQKALDYSYAEFDAWLSDQRCQLLIDRVCTIHALCLRLLKWYGYEVKVLSGEWSWKEKQLVQDALAELDWDEGYKAVSHWIGKAIESLVLPEQSERWFAQQLGAMGGPVWAARNMAEVYRRRQDFMKANGLVDFDMMQARVVWLLRNDPKFREWVTGLFDVIMVDEAQDTSPIQSEILFALASQTRRIVYIGDVDQSMYRFRGAEPEVLRSHFLARWENVTRFNLPINYRSTQAIVSWASQAIQLNYADDATYLKPFQFGPSASEGEPVGYTHLETFDELVSECASLVQDEPGKWFILSRTRAECGAIHMGLVAAGIPAINKSGGLLLGAPHIRKALAYLRLACDYQHARDNIEVISEIANIASAQFRAPMNYRRHRAGCEGERKFWIDCGCPLVREEGVDYSHARYYGKKSLEEAASNRRGLWAGVEEHQYDENRGGYPTTKAKASRDLVQFVERLGRLSDSALTCLETVISDCLVPWLQAEEGLTDEDLAENGKLEEFQVLTGLVDGPEMTVEQYLMKLDTLAAGEGSSGEAESVIVGTIHWSKGSERPAVIVNTTRLPIVPPKPILGKLPTGLPPSVEEERRLFYVAGTRARERLVLLGAAEWQGQELPESVFIGKSL